MRYATKILNHDTARLMIGIDPPADPQRKPSLVRHYLTDQGNPAKTAAALLGFEAGQPCLLVLNVITGDLISLCEPDMGVSDRLWHHYRINSRFELQPFKIKGRDLTFEERVTHITRENGRPPQQPGSCEEELRVFLTVRNYPSWLMGILDRQIRNWRDNDPAKYFHLAHWAVTVGELPGCVDSAPFAALRFFKSKLSAEQRALCIRTSLKGGVLFAFDEMSPGQIELAACECPGDLLIHRINHLTDAQLGACARNDPAMAFGIRHLLPPERHAIVLSITYLEGFPGMFRGRLPGFQEEVGSSIARFPEPWLNAHQGDFDQLFKMLNGFLQMPVDSGFKARLLKRMTGGHADLLARHLAKEI